MKKAVQAQINEIVEKFVRDNNWCIDCFDFDEWKPLRTCKAEVLDLGHIVLLRSYKTIVAAIDRNTDTLYDFSRLVYGYTSTTSQHIAIFNHDYCAGFWGCDVVRTWRDVK